MISTTEIDVNEPHPLTTAARAAVTAARSAVVGMRDDGTCNMDSVFLRVPRRSRATDAALDAAGVSWSFGDYGWRGRGYLVGLGVGGQGATRTKAAEVATKTLTSHGLQASVWYQMD